MSEPTAEEREEQLGALRKRMGRLLRKGDVGGYERLSAEYAEAKAVHVVRSREERRERVRARRAAREAVRVQEAPSRVWRLPRGFVSPLAAQRAREPLPAPAPRVPAGGHLSPWRGGSPMQERLWRP